MENVKKSKSSRMKRNYKIKKAVSISLSLCISFAAIGGAAYGFYALASKDSREFLATNPKNSFEDIYEKEQFCGYEDGDKEIGAYICYANNIQVRSSYRGLFENKEITYIADFLKKNVFNGVEGLGNSVIEFSPGLKLSNGSYTKGFRTDSNQRESKLDVSPDFYDYQTSILDRPISTNLLKSNFLLNYGSNEQQIEYAKKTNSVFTDDLFINKILSKSNAQFQIFGDATNQFFASRNYNQYLQSTVTGNYNTISDTLQRVLLSNTAKSLKKQIEKETSYSELGIEEKNQVDQRIKAKLFADTLSNNIERTSYFNDNINQSELDSKREEQFNLVNNNDFFVGGRNFSERWAYHILTPIMRKGRDYFLIKEFSKSGSSPLNNFSDRTTSFQKIKAIYLDILKYYGEAKINSDVATFVEEIVEKLYIEAIEEINLSGRNSAELESSISKFVDWYTSLSNNSQMISYAIYVWTNVMSTPASSEYGQTTAMSVMFSNNINSYLRALKRILQISNNDPISRRMDVEFAKTYKNSGKFYPFTPEFLGFTSEKQLEDFRTNFTNRLINNTLYTISHEYGHHLTLSNAQSGSKYGSDLLDVYTVEEQSATSYNKAVIKDFYETIFRTSNATEYQKYNWLSSSDKSTATQVIAPFVLDVQVNRQHSSDHFGYSNSITGNREEIFPLTGIRYDRNVTNDAAMFAYDQSANYTDNVVIVRGIRGVRFDLGTNYGEKLDIAKFSNWKFSSLDTNVAALNLSREQSLGFSATPTVSLLTTSIMNPLPSGTLPIPSANIISHNSALTPVFPNFGFTETSAQRTLFEQFVTFNIRDEEFENFVYSSINSSQEKVFAGKDKKWWDEKFKTYEETSTISGLFFPTTALPRFYREYWDASGASFKTGFNSASIGSNPGVFDGNTLLRYTHTTGRTSTKLSYAAKTVNFNTISSLLTNYHQILRRYNKGNFDYIDEITYEHLSKYLRDVLRQERWFENGNSVFKPIPIHLLTIIEGIERARDEERKSGKINDTISPKQVFLDFYKTLAKLEDSKPLNDDKTAYSTSPSIQQQIIRNSLANEIVTRANDIYRSILDGIISYQHTIEKYIPGISINNSTRDEIVNIQKAWTNKDTGVSSLKNGITFKIDGNTIEPTDFVKNTGSGINVKEYFDGLIAGRLPYRTELAELLTRFLQILTFRGYDEKTFWSATNDSVSDILLDYNTSRTMGLELYDSMGFITQQGKDLFDFYRRLIGLKLSETEKDPNGLYKVIDAASVTSFFKTFKNRNTVFGGWIKKGDAEKYKYVKFTKVGSNKTHYGKLYTTNTSNHFLHTKLFNLDSQYSDSRNNDVTGEYIQWTSDPFITGNYVNSDLDVGDWEIEFVISKSNNLDALSPTIIIRDSRHTRLNYNYYPDFLSGDNYILIIIDQSNQRRKTIMRVD